MSTVAGQRHPHMWPNRGHSPPPSLRKAQHYCTTVSISYTPLQHTATVAPETAQTDHQFVRA